MHVLTSRRQPHICALGSPPPLFTFLSACCRKQNTLKKQCTVLFGGMICVNKGYTPKTTSDLCVPSLPQVQGHVDDAVANGARVTIGGKRPDLPQPYDKVLHSVLLQAVRACGPWLPSRHALAS